VTFSQPPTGPASPTADGSTSWSAAANEQGDELLLKQIKNLFDIESGTFQMIKMEFPENQAFREQPDASV
jgi:hypothetical protein